MASVNLIRPTEDPVIIRCEIYIVGLNKSKYKYQEISVDEFREDRYSHHFKQNVRK
jgi:hypothetical protein